MLSICLKHETSFQLLKYLQNISGRENDVLCSWICCSFLLFILGTVVLSYFYGS